MRVREAPLHAPGGPQTQYPTGVQPWTPAGTSYWTRWLQCRREPGAHSGPPLQRMQGCRASIRGRSTMTMWCTPKEVYMKCTYEVRGHAHPRCSSIRHR